MNSHTSQRKIKYAQPRPQKVSVSWSWCFIPSTPGTAWVLLGLEVRGKDTVAVPRPGPGSVPEALGLRFRARATRTIPAPSSKAPESWPISTGAGTSRSGWGVGGDAGRRPGRVGLQARDGRAAASEGAETRMPGLTSSRPAAARV